jgi:hypothetical protein
MSTIQVQAPGLQTTVQDLGRNGFGPAGVSPSGAADRISLRMGNRLVGNDENAAGLEMMLLGGTFSFPNGAILALTGSDFGATLNDAPLDVGTSVEVRPGQTLRLGPTNSGARCYLCVRGRIEVKPFLGSASTHILSGLGGFEGRALRKGDVLSIGSSTGPFRKRMIAPEASEHLSHRPARDSWPAGGVVFGVLVALVLCGHLSRGRAIESHGTSARGRRDCTARSGADDHRRRIARSDSGACSRIAHHSFCGATDDGRLSEDRKCDCRRYSSRGATSAS